MPQMAPMSWVLLFIMFSTIFMIINSMNYFSFKYSPLSSSSHISYNKINWKW